MTINSSMFQLDKRLADDTYPILETDDFYLRLNKNALVPWFILVPKTNEIELFACENQFKQRIRQTVDRLAAFSQDYFKADKMNIAALGNVVSQLHIHIIARHHDDFAWPGPVWCKTDYLDYDDQQKGDIIASVKQAL
ncbi:MAG: HIT family protein [Gammaproteobacteria bacterium]|nr:MAG: HIT family protein [Gammaproteobacteria bacterium]